MRGNQIFTVLLLLLAKISCWGRENNLGPALTGPILYGIQGTTGQLFKIDVMSCTICPIATLNVGALATDVLVLPNGDIFVNANNGLKRYTPPNPNPVWTNSAPGFLYEGSVLAPDGNVYLSRTSPSAGLSVYNPGTNTVTFVGAWPAGMILTEFFYQNGVLYAFGGLSFSGVVVEVNLTNPGLSTVVNSGLPVNTGGTTNGGYTTDLNGSLLTTL
jgi:hypothetical protein